MANNLFAGRNEQELISKCLENNKLAQQQMYDLLKGRMFAVCLRYVVDKEFAKDVFHEGFVILFSKLETYKGEGSFEGWARRIFVTTCLMHLRKNDVLKRSEQIDDYNASLQTDSTVFSKLEAKALLELVMQMPVGFRTVFNMYAIEGYTHEEIAKELNITPGGSRSQLSRARIWLQEKLKSKKY